MALRSEIELLTCFSFIEVKSLVKILELPISNVKFFQISPGEYFISTIKISFYTGLLFSSPFVIGQLILFLLPGLTKKETKIILTGRSLESRLSKEELNRLNAEYVSCDITNKVAVNDLIENTLSKYGKINGIIHSAGVIKDSFLITKKSEDAREVLKPKIEGVKLLDQATVNVDLDFFVLFSSMAGVVGNYGQADYSSANAWLDFYAIYRNDLEKKGKRKGHCLSINWLFYTMKLT